VLATVVAVELVTEVGPRARQLAGAVQVAVLEVTEGLEEAGDVAPEGTVDRTVHAHLGHGVHPRSPRTVSRHVGAIAP
jgi:hypothetical protein